MDSDHERHDKETQKKIRADVKKYGCHFGLLQADNYMPAYAYSIGFYKTWKHPEIICFGLPLNTLTFILNEAQRQIQAGVVFTPEKDWSDFLEGYDVRFIPVDQSYYPDYLGYGCWFYKYRTDFPALQLVWPDKTGLFPWQDGFNSNWKFSQPLLDRNMDFKFYEDRALGVYTSQSVLDGAPVLRVTHDADGDWQFLSGNPVESGEGRLVCLEELVKVDPSLNKVFWLQYGQSAQRESREHKFTFGPLKEE